MPQSMGTTSEVETAGLRHCRVGRSAVSGVGTGEHERGGCAPRAKRSDPMEGGLSRVFGTAEFEYSDEQSPNGATPPRWREHSGTIMTLGGCRPTSSLILTPTPGPFAVEGRHFAYPRGCRTEFIAPAA